MKFSTEAIVALSVAVVFGLLSFGAIAREEGQGSVAGKQSVQIAASNVHLTQVATNRADVLGFY